MIETFILVIQFNKPRWINFSEIHILVAFIFWQFWWLWLTANEDMKFQNKNGIIADLTATQQTFTDQALSIQFS